MKFAAPILALAVMAAATVPTDASAQRTGTRIGKTATKYDTSETIALVTACMAERRNQISREILDTLPGTEAEHRVMLRSEGPLGICMDDERFVLDGKKLEFTGRALRPSLGVAVARQLISASNGAATVRASDKPWFADALDAVADGAELDTPLLALFEMGDCLVSRESTGAMELVMSEPGKGGQGPAMRKLIPHLSHCVVTGQEIEITPEVLRFAVAEPIVHRFQPVVEVGAKQ